MALNDGLIFGSHFNSGTATDWSGVSGNGTVSGATATTDKNSISNQALDFDGSNDKVTISLSSSSLESISIWFKPSVTITTSINSYLFDLAPTPKRGIRLGNVTGNATNEMILISHEGNADFFWWDTSTISSFLSSQWYNLIFVWETSNYRVYINGVDKGLAMIFGSPIQLSNNSVEFGVYNNAFFDGKMDEPRIWDRDLSSGEATEVFNLYDSEEVVGYSNKVNGITPSKINGIDVANISKFNGI